MSRNLIYVQMLFEWTTFHSHEAWLLFTHMLSKTIPLVSLQRWLSLPWTSCQLCNSKAAFSMSKFDQLTQSAYWDCLLTVPFCTCFHLICSTTLSTLLAGVCKSFPEAFNFKQREVKKRLLWKTCLSLLLHTEKYCFPFISLSFPIQEFISYFLLWFKLASS